MKFIAGVVVGLVLASTTTALAVTVWQTGSQLMDNSRQFRLGYVAGASDMLAAVFGYLASTHEQVKLLGQDSCLNARSKGGLDQFTRWAERFFLGRDEQAASILLDHACE